MMKNIRPGRGLLGRNRWVLLAAFLIFLPACLANRSMTERKEADTDLSASKKEMTSVEGHPYVYNRPHQVPADYVYRTERILSPPPQKPSLLQGVLAGDNGEPQASPVSPDKQYAARLVEGVKNLVSQLLRAGGDGLEEDQRVLVSSFVNLNDLYKTSALGRVLGEQVISELQHAGIEVLDMRKTPGLLVHQKLGEYGLSRDMEELPYIHEAHATVVGTYSEATGQLFVNARILRNSDGLVMAAASMILEKNALLSSLLEDETAPVERRLSTVQMEVQ